MVTLSKCQAKSMPRYAYLSSKSINDDGFCPTTFPTLINLPFTLLKAFANISSSLLLNTNSRETVFFKFLQSIPEVGP